MSDFQGTSGDDIYVGGDGGEVMNGGRGNDELTGGAGDDDINGGLGDDILYGNDGNDYLDGVRGVDYLDGGAGNDILRAAFSQDGNTTLIGGAGDDEFVINPAGFQGGADMFCDAGAGDVINLLDFTSIFGSESITTNAGDGNDIAFETPWGNALLHVPGDTPVADIWF